MKNMIRKRAQCRKCGRYTTVWHAISWMEETSGYAHSESDYGGEKTSTGKSEQEIRVVSPQDFIDMDDGEAVCFIGKKIGTFHETAKVVNSLFGGTWGIAEFGPTNCQLGFEGCQKIKPFRIKSMDARRHQLLAKRFGLKPPELLRLPPFAESQLEHQATPIPPPLAAWHYDPQLFRKWPQMAQGRGEGENLQEHLEANEVSLGL